MRTLESIYVEGQEGEKDYMNYGKSENSKKKKENRDKKKNF